MSSASPTNSRPTPVQADGFGKRPLGCDPFSAPKKDSNLAIGYVRAGYISRGAGHSTIKRLAYVTRKRLHDRRTGVSFDYTARQDLIGDPETMLPPGAPSVFAEGIELWSAIEAASKHKLATLGIEMIIALPPASELELPWAVRMLREFIDKVIVAPHGLGVTFAMHGPHGWLADEDASNELVQSQSDLFAEAMASTALNFHAHVLITARQIGPSGIGRRRYKVLDPTIKRGNAVDSVRWGEVWGGFQNQFFAERGLDLRVRPRSPLSAETAPLHEVRRWRRAVKDKRPGVNGRDLLVDPAVEAHNAGVLRSIEGVATLMQRPFTWADLEHLMLRHFDARTAADLTERMANSPEFLNLTDPYGRPSRWQSSKAAVRAELAAFALALFLGQQESHPLDTEILRQGGFDNASRDFLSAVLTGPRLLVIDAFRSPAAMLEDVARICEEKGRPLVSISHGAGSTHAATIIRTVEELQRRPVSNSIIVVDRSDALTGHALTTIFKAAIAGQSRVILVRRHPEPLWVRSELVDLIGRSTVRLALGRRQDKFSIAHAFREKSFTFAVATLARQGQILFAQGPAQTDDVLVDTARRAAHDNVSVSVLVPNAERARRLQLKLDREAIAAAALTRLGEGRPSHVVALVGEPALHGPMLMPQLGNSPNLTLVVDRSRIKRLGVLAALMALDSAPQSATVTTVETAAPSRLRQPRLLPEFALNPDGERVFLDDQIIDAAANLAAISPRIRWDRSSSPDPGAIAEAIRQAIETMGGGPTTKLALGTAENGRSSRGFDANGVVPPESLHPALEDEYGAEVRAFDWLEDEHDDDSHEADFDDRRNEPVEDDFGPEQSEPEFKQEHDLE
jgi:hypothetical protein